MWSAAAATITTCAGSGKLTRRGAATTVLLPAGPCPSWPSVARPQVYSFPLTRRGAATLEAVALPVRVAQVSCGSQHFAALGTAGDVYTWGAGNYGKLGLGGRDDVATPSLVRGQLEGKTSRAVSCGDHHSAVISSEGQLLTWGRGAQGRLVRHTHGCRLHISVALKTILNAQAHAKHPSFSLCLGRCLASLSPGDMIVQVVCINLIVVGVAGPQG